MKRESKSPATFGDYLGCFGGFQKDETICKRFCVLRIRCAIQQDHNERLEVMEELVACERMALKIQ